MMNSANTSTFDTRGFEASQAEAGGQAVTHQPPHIVPLGEAGQSPVELVGGKAKELGRLMAEGYRVPDGFVITTAVNPDSELPDAVIQALDSSEPRAFRSSAVEEDGTEASFAGQFESVLDVRGAEAGLRALRRCWSSGESASLAAYAARTRHSGGAIAVVVQAMVRPVCAGVAFSKNPVTGADEVIVEAVKGLGDVLMEGLANPERWSVSREGVAERLGGPDDVFPAGLPGRVADLCRRLAESWGTPQDVEWAFDGEHLFVLQARPITALPIPLTERPPPRQTWSRDEEHVPMAVVPFVGSVLCRTFETTIPPVMQSVGLPMEGIQCRLFGARLYMRMIPPGDNGVDDARMPPRWVLWLLLRLMPAMRRAMNKAAEAARTDLPMRAADLWDREGREATAARTLSLRKVNREALSDQQLAAHIEEAIAHFGLATSLHMELATVSDGATVGRLGRLLQTQAGWSAGEVLDLLQGYSAPSVEASVELDRVADAVAADPDALAALEEGAGRILTYQGPAGQLLRSLVERRGHQPVSLALQHPMWAEDPTPLVGLLRARLRRAAASDPMEISAAAEARARAAVPEACWPEIQLALDRARRARPHRDSSEDAMFAALGPLRYALVEAGRRLAGRGELGRVDDIWYLEQDEVIGLLRGQSCEADIARRRGEFRWAEGNPLDRVLGPPASGMPDMPLPKPARAILDDLFWSFNLDPMMNAALQPQPAANAFLTGIPCSPGQAEGRVVVVDRPEQLHLLEPGDILVCIGTTAAWSFAFSVVGGVITEVGGPLSHPATLAREYCLPAILNVTGATTALRTGDRVRIDGATGQIELLDG